MGDSGTQLRSNLLTKLPRIWRIATIAAAAWVIGYTLPFLNMYSAAIKVEAPIPPIESFDDWLARQTEQARVSVAACVEQRRELWDLPSDDVLIELEAQRRVATMGETREQAQSAAEANASASEERRRKDVSERCEASVGWIDNTQYDRTYRERRGAVDELHHRAWGRVENTLIGLLGILAIPLAAGIVRRLYGWVMAGR